MFHRFLVFFEASTEICVSFPRYNSYHNLCMGLSKWRHESDLSVPDLSVWETNSRCSDVVFEKL